MGERRQQSLDEMRALVTTSLEVFSLGREDDTQAIAMELEELLKQGASLALAACSERSRPLLEDIVRGTQAILVSPAGHYRRVDVRTCLLCLELLIAVACVSACKFDPLSGVIGVQY